MRHLLQRPPGVGEGTLPRQLGQVVRRLNPRSGGLPVAHLDPAGDDQARDRLLLGGLRHSGDDLAAERGGVESPFPGDHQVCARHLRGQPEGPGNQLQAGHPGGAQGEQRGAEPSGRASTQSRKSG